MKLFRFFFLFAAASAALLLPGCGYHLGSIAHPQIKTVAIADVKNETYEVRAASILRGILAERFQFDNSLKLTSLDKADCIVYARVIKVASRDISWNYNSKIEDYRANEYRLDVTVEFTVLMPGRSLPLVPSSKVSGSSIYLFALDPAIGRIGALKQAMLRISNQIVTATTEAW